MKIEPLKIPKMRLVGTEAAVKFAESLALQAEKLDPKQVETDFTNHSDWLFKYPAPLIGERFERSKIKDQLPAFEKDNVVSTMSLPTLRLGKLFATTLADNYRLREKGNDLIKFNVVKLLVEEQFLNIQNLYRITDSSGSNVIGKVSVREELHLVSLWLVTCFCLAFSLALCSLFPAHESSSGVLRDMHVGTPTVVYWATVAALDLGIHLLVLTVCCTGFIWFAGPPSALGAALILFGGMGAFFSCVPIVYIVAAYVTNPVKVCSVVMLSLISLPVASYYSDNVAFVVRQVTFNQISDDSTIRTLLMVFSPVHASALLTTFVTYLTSPNRYTEQQLFDATGPLLNYCWAPALAWSIMLIVTSKSLHRLLRKAYYKMRSLAITEAPDSRKSAKKPSKPAGGDKKEETANEPPNEAPLPARIGAVTESTKVKKGAAAAAVPPKKDPKKDDAAAAKPATPATPAAAAAKKDEKKPETNFLQLYLLQRSLQPEAKSAAAAAPKVDPSTNPKAVDKNPEDQKEQPKTDTPNKNKAIEATRKDLIEDKKAPAASTHPGKTPTKDAATTETQGITPVPMPMNQSKKRTGVGRDERAARAERERDELAIRYAELEKKYRRTQKYCSCSAEEEDTHRSFTPIPILTKRFKDNKVCVCNSNILCVISTEQYRLVDKQFPKLVISWRMIEA